MLCLHTCLPFALDQEATFEIDFQVSSVFHSLVLVTK